MSTFMFRLRQMAMAIGLTVALAAAAITGAAAQDADVPEFKQIELNDKLVAAFIAAQKDFAPLAPKLMEAGETLDDALVKELEDIAKKHGFANFGEFEDVGANITLVLDGLDRSTGAYTDPVERMKKELEEIKADDTIPADDKKLAIDDLTQEIAIAPPIKFPGNVDVVKKHIAEIEALIPDEADFDDDDDDDDDGPAPDKK